MPEEEQYESPNTPRIPRDKNFNQRVHMELRLAPETEASEDGLVRHQKEERPLIRKDLM